MKTTLKIALFTVLFCTIGLADGQQGTGGRTCPPECTIETPENCVPPCTPPGDGGRVAPEVYVKTDLESLTEKVLTRIARMYFVGR